VKPIRQDVRRIELKRRTSAKRRYKGGVPSATDDYVFVLACGHVQRRRPSQGVKGSTERQEYRPVSCVTCTLALMPFPTFAHEDEGCA
jgi:hypothetical protein